MLAQANPCALPRWRATTSVSINHQLTIARRKAWGRGAGRTMGQAQRVVEDKLATELFIPTRPRISLAKSPPAAEQPDPAGAPHDRTANREFGSVLRKIRGAGDALRASELRVSDL